jgi:hypothetical protein
VLVQHRAGPRAFLYCATQATLVGLRVRLTAELDACLMLDLRECVSSVAADASSTAPRRATSISARIAGAETDQRPVLDRYLLQFNVYKLKTGSICKRSAAPAAGTCGLQGHAPCTSHWLLLNQSDAAIMYLFSYPGFTRDFRDGCFGANLVVPKVQHSAS